MKPRVFQSGKMWAVSVNGLYVGSGGYLSWQDAVDYALRVCGALETSRVLELAPC